MRSRRSLRYDANGFMEGYETFAHIAGTYGIMMIYE
jgi:hypothetical protein